MTEFLHNLPAGKHGKGGIPTKFCSDWIGV